PMNASKGLDEFIDRGARLPSHVRLQHHLAQEAEADALERVLQGGHRFPSSPYLRSSATRSPVWRSHVLTPRPSREAIASSASFCFVVRRTLTTSSFVSFVGFFVRGIGHLPFGRFLILEITSSRLPIIMSVTPVRWTGSLAQACLNSSSVWTHSSSSCSVVGRRRPSMGSSVSRAEWSFSRAWVTFPPPRS